MMGAVKTFETGIGCGWDPFHVVPSFHTQLVVVTSKKVQSVPANVLEGAKPPPPERAQGWHKKNRESNETD